MKISKRIEDKGLSYEVRHLLMVHLHI